MLRKPLKTGVRDAGAGLRLGRKTLGRRRHSQGDKPILYNGAWRCGNCKSRLITVGGVFRCTNEYCGMKYDAERALAEALRS
jgi:hypothetical protein